MTLKNRIYFVIFVIVEFVGLLFFLGFIATKAVEAGNYALRWDLSLVASVPGHHGLTPVSFSRLVVQGQVLGAVAVYDDATTERPADYLELYDNAGHLLAVGWFDRFGIERMAVDRSLLEDADEPEGVFVVVLDGDLT